MEIKFRGKRVDNGEWVYGCFIYRYSSLMKKNQCFIVENIDFDIRKNWIESYCAYEVIEETVGQSTDLKDKNGKDIYVTDILIDKTGRTLYCAFEECQFKITDKYGGTIKMTQDFINWFELEIIGNIFDNKELLEEIK